MPKGRVMVVDDEFDIAFIVRKYLEKWGFTVDTFTNPLYAFQQFKKTPGQYDVVLLDIRMPEMSGIELAERMLKIRPDAEIVMMTAFEITAEDLNFRLPRLQNDDILKKPFQLVQICTAVKKHLQTA
jgi:DNA-binding response OmpR family regulator